MNKMFTEFDNGVRFDANAESFVESFYVNWSDQTTQRAMVTRYVMVNGGSAETSFAEVWCWFRDKKKGIDKSYRQQYPLSAAKYTKGETGIMIGNSCSLDENRCKGRILADGDDISWDFDLDKSSAVAINRVPDTEKLDYFFQFRSLGCKQSLSGTLSVNELYYDIDNVKATDGHYWNVQQLQTWSWANCVDFEEDSSAVLESIGYCLYQPCAPTITHSALKTDSGFYQNGALDSVYRNSSSYTDSKSWQYSSESDGCYYEAKLSADSDDMILILHPLPDGNFLYTTISLFANAVVDVFEEKGGNKTKQLNARGCASFEVTSPVKNEAVTREFKIVPAHSTLL
ncbi:MAG: hypothetical protein DHS20C12_30180 [Pseudohongiella sp.]|nr:MAG: hypothetical protein DHS20C12_30180 [Pseudohongiella sp.]